MAYRSTLLPDFTFSLCVLEDIHMYAIKLQRIK